MTAHHDGGEGTGTHNLKRNRRELGSSLGPAPCHTPLSLQCDPRYKTVTSGSASVCHEGETEAQRQQKKKGWNRPGNLRAAAAGGLIEASPVDSYILN